MRARIVIVIGVILLVYLSSSLYTRGNLATQGKTLKLTPVSNEYSWQSSPCPSSFQHPVYFEDISVTETVTRRKLTISEVMELLDRQPNVKTVSLAIDPPRPFSLETLAYPQYANRYKLTREEWGALQYYAKQRLEKDGNLAVPEVVAHWRSIITGNPPFGIQIQR